MSLSSVMIVDDSEADQFISHSLIRKHDADIEILQAYDGLEALEILDEIEHEPSVIFLDINMPRMNGHEFLAAYDKRPKSNAAVIVMLTSSSQQVDKDKSKAYRCVKEYYEKPLNLDQLLMVEKLGL